MTNAVKAVQKELSQDGLHALVELIKGAKKSKLEKEKEVENFINAMLGLMLEHTQLLTADIEKLLLDLQHLIEKPDMLQLYLSSVRSKCNADKSRSAVGTKRLRQTTTADINKMTMPVAATITAGKRSNYMCPICKDMAIEPCAALCGHVCCRQCWGHWLRVGKNPVCPSCKRPADPQTLTPIVMLKG